MYYLLKAFLLLIYLFVNNTFFKVIAAEALTGPQIHAYFQTIIDRRGQPKNGPTTSFRFQQFIKSAAIPLNNQVDLQNSILGLRSLYLDALPNNFVGGISVLTILENHLDNSFFVANKLLEEEIGYLNQFVISAGAALPALVIPTTAALVPSYQAAVDQITANFNRMVGIITLNDGCVTGTLIPLPILPAPAVGLPAYQWAVLTCGHIMECISRTDNLAEEGSFILNGVLPIPIRSIKVFKRNGRESFVGRPGLGGAIVHSPANSIELGGLARSLPRYDSEGDVAICYLGDAAHTPPGFTQALLNGMYPVNHYQFNVAARTISFQVNNNAISFLFINTLAEANAKVAAINAVPKNRQFIIGHAGFNPYTETLSSARNGATQLHATFLDAANVTSYNFFHDAPTYSGMSGGPIFYLAPPVAPGGFNTINVYGVVQGMDFGLLAAAHPSRCKGSFLQENLLQ